MRGCPYRRVNATMTAQRLARADRAPPPYPNPVSKCLTIDPRAFCGILAGVGVLACHVVDSCIGHYKVRLEMELWSQNNVNGSVKWEFETTPMTLRPSAETNPQNVPLFAPGTNEAYNSFKAQSLATEDQSGIVIFWR